MLKYEAVDFLSIIIPVFVSILSENKTKLKVVGITDINGLIEWMTKYFEINSGEVIHEEIDYMVFQVAEEKKRIFRTKTDYTYYEIKIGNESAIVEAPEYRKPKRAINKE